MRLHETVQPRSFFTKNLDGSPMVRRERIVVPIFGVVQPFKITTGEEDYY